MRRKEGGERREDEREGEGREEGEGGLHQEDPFYFESVA